MKTIFTLFILITLVLVGCESDLMTDEIKSRLIEANTDLDSYSMQVNMIMTMNSTDGDLKTAMKTEGMIDRPNKKLGMTGSIESNIMGMTMDVPYESYIIEDKIYTKSMNMWMKMNLDENIWAQQDQIAQIVELVDTGSIDKQPDQTVKGIEYYVVTVHPDIKKLIEISLQGQEDALSEIENIEDMIKDYSVTLWINQESWVIEKSKTNMLMDITNDDGRSIELSTSMIVTIGDINQPMDINLPEDASNAIDMTGEGVEQDQRLPTSITGSAIAEALQ